MSITVQNSSLVEPEISNLTLPHFLSKITQRIMEENYQISKTEAVQIGSIPKTDVLLLFHYAHKLRRFYRGESVSLCSIINAKSGACTEDCSFCAQSVHYSTGAPVYPMLQIDEILTAARQAKQDGAASFGIVISGQCIKNQKELEQIGEIAKAVRRETGLDVHGALGELTLESARYLRECGITTINHNLETSENFYPQICTTHTYQDRLYTLKIVRESGMKLCVGGIFGMGETLEDRIDLAMALRELEVETVPMNFLHPIPGTPLQNIAPLSPITILCIIALFRFILPRQEIKICGGREKNLRDLQSMIFFAGADSMMIGNYLTTAGREPELDWQMMRDLEMDWQTE